MTYANDWKKVVLAEIKPGIELNSATWTPDGSTGAYSCPFIHGEVVDVNADGVALTAETTLAACESTEASFYMDFFNQLLYVHLTGGYDPGMFSSGTEYQFSIVGFFWLCFANNQFTGDDALDFTPTGCIHPHFYEPWLSEDSIDSLSAAISDNYSSAMEISFGSLALINSNGWWYAYRHTYLWNNKDVRIKIGQRGDAYSDYETIFIGKVRGPSVDDSMAVFELVDSRVGSLYSIPTKYFSLTDYPNLVDDAIGRPIPILFGQKTNITPTSINTSTYVYKISDTIWDGVTYALEEIYRVYKGGIQLVEGTDFTVDLDNGEFTLLADPTDEIITCDAKGIQDGFDMTTGAKTGIYSENVADHLFFIFVVLNKIPIAQMDLDSFWDLQNARTQQVAWYLDTDTPTMDINRMFQQTSIYHFLPLQDGTFAAKYYRRYVPAGTINLFNHDFDGFRIYDQPENVFYRVIIKYDKDPTTGIFKTVSATEDLVDWHFSEKQTFEIETALRDETEAEAVCTFYQTLLNAPADKLEGNLSLMARNLLPSEKVIVTRTAQTEAGVLSILDEDVYVILESNKDFVGGKVGIVAQLDSQLAIYPVHSDLAHQDSHTDHTDNVHTDSAHSDHTDSTHSDHTDNSHANVIHEDVAHEDVPAHDDHTDHTDGTYSDGGHSDDPHEDVTHEDVAHVDTTYSDHDDNISYVPHANVAHQDHDDVMHQDEHADVSHIDSEL